ncbi:MAG: hypothetical protein RR202_10550 [Bacteroidales bacterium]
MSARSAAYKAIMDSVMAINEDDVIPEITDVIISVNEKFVSSRISSSKGVILFVEYGNIRLSFDGYGSQAADLAVTVADNFNVANMDVIQEAIVMERCYTILDRIMSRLNEEQSRVDWVSPLIRQISFPATIYTVEPQKFYDRCGFAAMFKREDTE